MPRNKRKRNHSGTVDKINCLKEWAKEKGLPTKKEVKETVLLNEY
jgi:uncharacterized protein YnzC (UPF0291/DUF896 family)